MITNSWTKVRHVAPAAALLATLLASVAAGVSFIDLANANGIPMPPLSNIYIRSDGSVEPLGAPILRLGNIYMVTSDLANSSIQVLRGNIVIEGGGFTLSGYGSHWYEGVYVSNVDGVKVQNLTIIGFGSGVNLANSSSNTIVGNKFAGCAYGVFLGRIDNNYVGSSDNNNITGNIATGGYGIGGVGSFNIIANNNFTGAPSGGGNGVGISISGNNNTVSFNTIIDEQSIDFGPSSQYNTISYNIIQNGTVGILLRKSFNNLIFGNVIGGKTDDDTGALYLSYGSFNNTIFNNQFENNRLAVSLGAQVVSMVWNNVYNNTFYRNNFVNNTQNVWIAPGAPINFWDNGEEGNHWSNYNGRDANGDGVGDSPYVINANNTDNYPLIKTASTGFPVPEFPTAVLPLALVIMVLAVVVASRLKKNTREKRI